MAGMVKICENEGKVTNKRSDENWGNLYTRDLPYSNIFYTIFLSRGEFDALRLLVL